MRFVISLVPRGFRSLALLEAYTVVARIYCRAQRRRVFDARPIIQTARFMYVNAAAEILAESYHTPAHDTFRYTRATRKPEYLPDRLPGPLDFYRCYRTYILYRLYRGTMSRYISAECRYLSPYESEVSICAFQRILQRSISRSLRFSLAVPGRPLFSSRSAIKSLPASNVCIHEIHGNRDRRYKSPLGENFCAIATFDNRIRRVASKVMKFAVVSANVGISCISCLLFTISKQRMLYKKLSLSFSSLSLCLSFFELRDVIYA